MSKIVAVVGATGGQGGSVVRALLKQGGYKVRGLTRNLHSEKAKALSAQGVELASADLDDEESLVKAFEGVTAIFAVTNFNEPFRKVGPEYAMDVEYKQGVNIARAAIKTPTLKHFIWSTLPDSRKVSNGKHVIPHFEAKARIDDFIKSQPQLLAKTTFLWITFYHTNFFYTVFQPYFLKSIGTYAYIQPVSPSTPISCAGDITVNTGVFAKAILANPSKTLGGKYVFGNVETIANSDFLALWGKATGKRTQYLQISFEECQKLIPIWGLELGGMLVYWEDAKEKSWSGDEELVTAADLGVEGELKTLEKSFRDTDWSSLLED